MHFSGTMLGSDNPKVLGEFYTRLIGEPGYHEGDWYAWQTGAQLMVGGHSEVHGHNHLPQRIILAFEVDDVKAEFDRIKDFGATVVAEPYRPDESSDVWLATLADPDGNYLQLARPWQDATDSTDGGS